MDWNNPLTGFSMVFSVGSMLYLVFTYSYRARNKAKLFSRINSAVNKKCQQCKNGTNKLYEAETEHKYETHDDGALTTKSSSGKYIVIKCDSCGHLAEIIRSDAGKNINLRIVEPTSRNLNRIFRGESTLSGCFTAFMWLFFALGVFGLSTKLIADLIFMFR